MKKLIKFTTIILINILLIVVIDIVAYAILSDANWNFREIIKNYKEHSRVIHFDELYNILISQDYFRNTIKETNKRPILIFGCSFGYGWLLNEKESFGHKLSNLTNRSVFNHSISSQGINYVPHVLENYNLEEKIKNPEYIIFVFIQNHAYRFYRQIMDIREPYMEVTYKKQNDSIVETKIPYDFIYKSAILRYINVKSRFLTYSKTDNDETFDLIKLLFIKAKNIANKKFPNSKFVILNYEDNTDNFFFNTERWKELEKEDIIVLNSYELTNVHLSDEKYRILNDPHPNEKAWDILTPKVVDALKL